MKLLIVDLSSVFFPAWHSGKDKSIGHAYEVSVDRIRRAAHGFEHVVIACDSGRSFRKDLAESYKAGRPDKDETLLDQLNRVQEAMAADGHLIAKASGFEADDVVATFARWAEQNGHEVEILSSDKDLLALVSEKVSVRSVQTDALGGPAQVQEKLGVPPALVRDYLALVGDASDGVKGVRGVGPQKAPALLHAHGSIDGILEALDAKDVDDNPVVVHSPSVHAALVAARDDGSLLLARQLVTLRFDVPIDCAKVLEPREAKTLAADEAYQPGTEPEDFEDDPAPAPTKGAAPAPANDAPEVQGEVVNSSAAMVLGGWSHALEPRSARDAHVMARHLFNSRLFGQAYGNTDAVFATILAGRELGVPALTALRGIHIIEGKPTMGAHLIVGIVLRSGLAKYFRLVESTDERATYETWRKGDPEPTRMTFTIEDAERAGLTKPTRNGKPSNWVTRPRPLLRKSAGVELARAVYPDVIANVYDPDEMRD